MHIKNTEIKIIRADITTLNTDAIVNAANNKFLMGGGVAGAIKRKGGQEIEDEAVALGPVKIGETVTTSAGSLPSKYVIHAATMGMPACRQAGVSLTDESAIRSAARNALIAAGKLKIESIAFPALGCGVGNFPYLASAKIMAQEVLKYLRATDTTLKEIIFCLYDKEAFDVFHKGVIDYLEYVTTKLGGGPFMTVDAIIEIDAGIVLIKRSNPPFGWALPGGFVDYGESLEQAVIREAKEETGLVLKELKQFHTYSEPGRDPRFHTISTVFIAKGQGEPCFGDDAADLKIIKLTDMQKIDFAFDHKKIIEDYLNSRHAV